MKDREKHRILVVDDEPLIRQTMSMMLTQEGCDVATAADGFDALNQIKVSTPGVIISDLNMPQMSGFEFLSVVRRRFPQIAVIAMSGAYASGDSVPGAVIADAFFAKGGKPESLFRVVGELLATAPSHAAAHMSQSAPVWIPRNGHDSNGVPFIVLTCTECLRSFPLSVSREDLQSVQEQAVCSVRTQSAMSSTFRAPSPRAGIKACGSVRAGSFMRIARA